MIFELEKEEIDILLTSGRHCLNTCQEGRTDQLCPDCQKLTRVMNKLKAGVIQ